MEKQYQIPPRGQQASTALTNDQFKAVIDHLMETGQVRLAVIGILLSSPMRIGDVLKTLRIDDVYDFQGIPRKEIRLKEEKTGNVRLVPIWLSEESKVYKILNTYYQSELKTRKRSDILFLNQKMKTPLSDVGVFTLLQQFKGRFGIEKISSHSFRKHCGAGLYGAGYDIEIISECYGHQSSKTTRRYLGIQPKFIREAQEALIGLRG